MLSTGQRVDRYIVEGRLGEGGMATVYRVRHETLGTPHALKVLTLTAKDVRNRMIREGQIQATLQHENIVQVTDVIDVKGSPGLLMEFVEGPTLEHWLSRYQPPLEEALTLFRGICAGVAYAHAKGLIHRDLKPANVLLALTEDRMTPKVTDFGLAKGLAQPAAVAAGATRTGATMGTPGYMSPEQIRDASTVDRRADLWSLGCLLYRVACGVPPFEGDDIIELFNQVAAGDYVPAATLKRDLPPRVHQAIERLLETDRARRIADVPVLMAFLDEVTPELPAPTATVVLDKAPMPSTDLPRWLPADSSAYRVARDVVEETLAHLPKLKVKGKRTWEHAETPAPAPEAARPQLRETLEPVVEDDGHTLHAAAPPRRRSRLWLVGAAFAALTGGVGMLAVAALAAFVIVTGTLPSEDTLLLPEPVADPKPVPVEVEPAPVVPEPVRPTPVRPTPTPPVPPAVPRTGNATVTFTGARQLWLEDPMTGKAAPGLDQVPPGRYRIKAVFEGEPEAVAAGETNLSPGDRVRLVCQSAMLQCRAR